MCTFIIIVFILLIYSNIIIINATTVLHDCHVPFMYFLLLDY